MFEAHHHAAQPAPMEMAQTQDAVCARVACVARPAWNTSSKSLMQEISTAIRLATIAWNRYTATAALVMRLHVSGAGVTTGCLARKLEVEIKGFIGPTAHQCARPQCAVRSAGMPYAVLIYKNSICQAAQSHAISPEPDARDQGRPLCDWRAFAANVRIRVALIQQLALFGVHQLLEKLLITIGNTEALSAAVRQCVRRRGLGMRSSPNRRCNLPVANAVEPIGQNGQ